MHRLFLWGSSTVVALVASLLSATACKDSGGAGGSGATGSSGMGGEGGCDTVPHALFNLHITAADGTLPKDTTIDAQWSGETIPEFRLDDPSTYKMLDMSDLVCDADPKTPPTKELVCHLWTGNATDVKVEAVGYEIFEQTLIPKMSEKCGKIPSDVDIVLMRLMDAG